MPSNFTLNGFTYKANAHPEMQKKGWKPSIFMPYKAARIFLKVVNIRCEQLQDITNEDAVLEGITPLNMSANQLATDGQLFFDYSKPKQFFNEGLPPFWSFNSLWCSINGNESWDENPFVWVIEFERCDRPNGCR